VLKENDPLTIQLGILAALRARLLSDAKPWAADVVEIVDEVEREVRAEAAAPTAHAVAP
jgi:hypothetical protein